MEHSLQDIIDNFGFFDDWEERYAYLIDLGKGFAPLSHEDKIDEYLVRGCTSRVWLIIDWVADDAGVMHMYLRADSDAHIVRGLVSLVLVAYNGLTAAQALSVDMNAAFHEMGLEAHLSPSRRNGFFSMVERIRTAAAQQSSLDSSR